MSASSQTTGAPDGASQLLNLRGLAVGMRLKVRRTALGLSQGGVGGLLGFPRSRVCEAERESRYRSPQKLAELQALIDYALSQVEAERRSDHDAQRPVEAAA